MKNAAAKTSPAPRSSTGAGSSGTGTSCTSMCPRACASSPWRGAGTAGARIVAGASPSVTATSAPGAGGGGDQLGAARALGLADDDCVAALGEHGGGCVGLDVGDPAADLLPLAREPLGSEADERSCAAPAGGALPGDGREVQDRGMGCEILGDQAGPREQPLAARVAVAAGLQRGGLAGAGWTPQLELLAVGLRRLPRSRARRSLRVRISVRAGPAFGGLQGAVESGAAGAAWSRIRARRWSRARRSCSRSATRLWGPFVQGACGKIGRRPARRRGRAARGADSARTKTMPLPVVVLA